jgi:hypothetical protein
MYSGTKSLHVTIVSPEPRQDRSHHVPKITIVGSGFPHSDISGSKLVRSSPELFAAYHVLHRLSVPRHPPNALKTLDRSHYRYSPGTKAQTIVACAAAMAMNMIRKTILLHHPSGTRSLQDLSSARSGRLPARPSCDERAKMHPGICLQSQRTKNNRMNVSLPCQTTPHDQDTRPAPSRKNVSS